MNKGRIGGIVVALVIIVGIIFALLCSEWIPAGYVGCVYSMKGGIQDDVLQQGFNIIAPWKKVKEFTIGNEQLVLSQDERDGSETDESFLVATADNANISISFQMSYRFIEDNVPDTYKKFRGMNGEQIVNNRVKTVLKSNISEVTTNYTMMDIYSGDREQINKKITSYLDKEFGEQFGIEVINASIIDVHPDAQLQKTIQDRVTAMQKKQQAQAEQETIKVQNETKLLEAKANAEAKKIAAEGEAEANRVIANSITDGLLKKMEMEARQQHGWVTVNGSGTVVTDAK